MMLISYLHLTYGKTYDKLKVTVVSARSTAQMTTSERDKIKENSFHVNQVCSFYTSESFKIYGKSGALRAPLFPLHILYVWYNLRQKQKQKQNHPAQKTIEKKKGKNLMNIIAFLVGVMLIPLCLVGLSVGHTDIQRGIKEWKQSEVLESVRQRERFLGTSPVKVVPEVTDLVTANINHERRRP